MLPNLLEVDQRIFHSLCDGGHTTQGSTLELLALEQRLSILEQSHIITGCISLLAYPVQVKVSNGQRPTNCLNQLLRSRQLREGYPEVICIVEGVEEIAVEGMDVLKFWEAVEDGLQFLREGLGSVFDLARVELCNN
jgi:hypothetical protein